MPHAKIELPLYAAKTMCKALLPHASRDNVTLALRGAWVTGKFAYATDRYTVGRYDLTNLIEDEPTQALFLPLRALDTIARLGSSILPYGTLSEAQVVVEGVWGSTSEHPWPDHVYVGVSEEVRDHTSTVWSRVFDATGADASRPPIERLFEKFVPGERAALDTTGEQMRKFASFAASEREHMRITMPATSDSKFPAPVLIEIGMRFKGLLQPNVAIDDTAYGAPLHADTQTPDSNS